MHFNLIWVFLEKFGTSLLSIGVFFIYAYILDPYDMGVAIIVLSVTQFLSIFISTFFEDAMVQLHEITKDHINTAFFASILFSLIAMVLTLVGFVYFGYDPENYNILALAGFASIEILLTNISVVYVAQLRRDGKFKVLALRVLIGRISGSLFGVVAILLGMGAWAIIIQSVIGTAMQTIILIYAVKSLPDFSVKYPILKYYFSFGSKLSLKRLSWDLSVRATPIIAGITLGTISAGHVGFAWRIVELFRSAIVSGLMNYLLPHFSRMQGSRDLMAKEFLSSTSIIAFVVTPIFLGLMITAPLIITTIFAEKWYAAIPLIQLYCISALMGCYRTAANVSITACGFPGKMLIEGLIVTALSILAMYLLAGLGIWIFGSIFIVSGIVLLPISISIIKNLLGLNWRQQLLPIAYYSLPGIIMAITLALSQNIFASNILINNLISQVTFGIIIFSGLSLTFYKNEIMVWKSGLLTKKGK